MLNPLRTASRKACGWCDAKPTIRRTWQWVIFCRFAHLDFGRTFFSCGHDQPIPCVPSTHVCRLSQLGCCVDRAANSPIAGDVACWPDGDFQPTLADVAWRRSSQHGFADARGLKINPSRGLDPPNLCEWLVKAGGTLGMLLPCRRFR